MNIRLGFFVTLLMAAVFAGGTGVAAEELGYIEEVLGLWDVKYPGPDGMITEGYVERLELRRDGTYLWNPPPAWALKTGKWGVVKTQDG